MRLERMPLGALCAATAASGLGGNLRSDGSCRDGSFAYDVSEPVATDDYTGVGPFTPAALELGK